MFIIILQKQKKNSTIQQWLHSVTGTVGRKHTSNKADGHVNIKTLLQRFWVWDHILNEDKPKIKLTSKIKTFMWQPTFCTGMN